MVSQNDRDVVLRYGFGHLRRAFVSLIVRQNASIHAKRFELGDVARAATDAAERTEDEFEPGVDMSVERQQRLKAVDAMKCNARRSIGRRAANRSNIGRAVRAPPVRPHRQ